MKNIITIIGIFTVLSMSRFIPHPPNFTSLIALSFYIPIFFGKRYIPILVIIFAITDIIIGYHSLTHWTWGSIMLIGLLSKYFKTNIVSRIIGAIVSSCLFFLITNFGFWTSGFYDYSIQGLINCYILAIPFFINNFVSTIIFSSIIEIFYNLKNKFFIEVKI